MSDSEQEQRNVYELEDLEDAEEAGRFVKCECERKMELSPDTVTTVKIEITVVTHRDRR